MDGSGGLTALFSLLNSPDWSRAERVLRERLPEATFRSGLAAATAIGDGLTGIAGPLAPARLARIVSDTAIAGAIVGPLRATVLCDDENAHAMFSWTISLMRWATSAAPPSSISAPSPFGGTNILRTRWAG